MVDFGNRVVSVRAKPEAVWRPYATYALLALIVVVFLLEIVINQVSGRQEVVNLFMVGPDWLARPWSVVTSVFAHSLDAIMHVVMNGLFLYFFGPTVERLVGVKRYLLVFLVTGMVAGVFQVEAERMLGDDVYALGASGGLMGLFGVLMILVPRQKVLMMGFIPLPLWVVGAIIAALDVLGIVQPSGTPIGRFAHLSGMALGLAVGWYFKTDLRRRGLRIVTH